MRVRLIFELRDLWVGVFWRRLEKVERVDAYRQRRSNTWQVYVCLIPCLPLLVEWDGQGRYEDLPWEPRLGVLVSWKGCNGESAIGKVVDEQQLFLVESWTGNREWIHSDHLRMPGFVA